MNFKFIFFLGLASILSSCNDQQQEPAVKEKPDTKSAANCYRYINNNDTIILKTIAVNGFITGTLVYNLYQKDKNAGTIQGQMNGEILFADYTFNSEGMQSVRPVAFKKTRENFIEGYGETEIKNGKTTFKNKDSLNYTHSFLLMPFDCEK